MMSIDTEMLWGPTSPNERAFLSGKGKADRDAIIALLKILEGHNIPATWAVVGHLFQDQCNELECPTSRNMSVHGYRPIWYRDPYSNLHLEPMYYGKDVVETLLSYSPNQEIGYHSYSHPIFTEISRAMAEEEIAKAREIEQEWGIKLKSFVFPQNKVAHVDLLSKHGFSIFRGKTIQRRNADMPLIARKFNGGVDKLIAHPVEPRFRDGIWEIPGSMAFSDPQFPSSVLFRAKIGVRRAIASKRIFHAFLHPWNLLINDRLKDELDDLLSYVAALRDEGEMKVMTMGEYAALLSEP